MKTLNKLLFGLITFAVMPFGPSFAKCEEAGGDGGAAGGAGAGDPGAGGDAGGAGGDPGAAGGDAGTGGAEGAPETYADFTLPEGMNADTELMEAYLPEFKARGLTQEQAQAEVSRYAEFVQKREQAQQTAYEDGVSRWEETTKADPELGGDHFDETKRLTSLALQKLGSEKLGEFLNEYGIGSHPEIVRVLRNAGKLVDEDGPSSGQGGSETTRLQRLYPDAKGSG